MKKLIILAFALIFSVKSIAQSNDAVDNANQGKERSIEKKMSKINQSNFLKDSNVKLLIEEAEKMGYLSGKEAYFEKESITTEGMIDRKKYSVSLFIYKLKSTDGSDENSFDVVQYSDNINKVTETWGETEKNVLTVENGKILKKEQKMGVQKSASVSCFSQYSNSSSCTNCLNCVNSCGGKNKKWKRIACAWDGCRGLCGSCIADFFGFISCFFK